MSLSPQELERVEALLARAETLDPDDPSHVRLERAVAGLAKAAKKRRRLARRRRRAAADRILIEQVRDASAAARTHGDPAAVAGLSDRLHRPRQCYACGQPYRDLQATYPMHCRSCAAVALRKRDQRTSLEGRRALVTGGRIKIGYALALKLLRDGAEVHVTTRFARDASRRFDAEDDVGAWRGRLNIHGVDFRSLPAVLERVAAWGAGPPFDILVNNAAQTVWRPPEYYRELWDGERDGHRPAWIRCEPPPTQAPLLLPDGGDERALFPEGQRDAVGNPLDLRRVNSWVQSLEEIEPLEMVEAQIVNVMVPFVLCSQLFDNLRRSPFERRFIVNVAAAEGQFGRSSRTGRHPHTNMAKAALNMLTASSAEDYARHGIYMVSADPGWASHEGPQDLVERARAAGAVPPLDMVDAAARLYDPIVRGIEGEPLFGCLLKNWVEQPW